MSKSCVSCLYVFDSMLKNPSSPRCWLCEKDKNHYNYFLRFDNKEKK